MPHEEDEIYTQARRMLVRNPEINHAFRSYLHLDASEKEVFYDLMAGWIIASREKQANIGRSLCELVFDIDPFWPHHSRYEPNYFRVDVGPVSQDGCPYCGR